MYYYPLYFHVIISKFEQLNMTVTSQTIMRKLAESSGAKVTVKKEFLSELKLVNFEK